MKKYSTITMINKNTELVAERPILRPYLNNGKLSFEFADNNDLEKLGKYLSEYYNKPDFNPKLVPPLSLFYKTYEEGQLETMWIIKGAQLIDLIFDAVDFTELPTLELVFSFSDYTFRNVYLEHIV
jgi:hypothetical protein